MNHEPDVAREGRDLLIDPDEIAVSFPKKARQAGHTDPGPHRDQVFTDVVQFAGYRAIAGKAEQPPLLRHVSKALIEGDDRSPLHAWHQAWHSPWLTSNDQLMPSCVADRSSIDEVGASYRLRTS
jgi:hypothetical protein